MTSPPTARNESDRVLAVLLKALLAGPQFHVWERAAAICAETAAAAADRAAGREDAGHAALLAAAAVVCAENTPYADEETVRAVIQAVRAAMAAGRRHPTGAPPEEAGYNPDDEDERSRLAETWIDQAINPEIRA